MVACIPELSRRSSKHVEGSFPQPWVEEFHGLDTSWWKSGRKRVGRQLYVFSS